VEGDGEEHREKGGQEGAGAHVEEGSRFCAGVGVDGRGGCSWKSEWTEGSLALS
jgi:hypothetical protein